jgi:hypothetical protein
MRVLLNTTIKVGGTDQTIALHSVRLHPYSLRRARCGPCTLPCPADIVYLPVCTPLLSAKGESVADAAKKFSIAHKLDKETMQTVFYFLNRKAAMAGYYKRELGTYTGLNYAGKVSCLAHTPSLCAAAAHPCLRLSCAPCVVTAAAAQNMPIKIFEDTNAKGLAEFLGIKLELVQRRPPPPASAPPPAPSLPRPPASPSPPPSLGFASSRPGRIVRTGLRITSAAGAWPLAGAECRRDGRAAARPGGLHRGPRAAAHAGGPAGAGHRTQLHRREAWS